MVARICHIDAYCGTFEVKSPKHHSSAMFFEGKYNVHEHSSSCSWFIKYKCINIFPFDRAAETLF